MLEISPCRLEGAEVVLVELDVNKARRVNVRDIESVQLEPVHCFYFKSPHMRKESYGRIVIKTKDNHQYKSGYLEDYVTTKQIIEEEIRNW